MCPTPLSPEHIPLFSLTPESHTLNPLFMIPLFPFLCSFFASIYIPKKYCFYFVCFNFIQRALFILGGLLFFLNITLIRFIHIVVNHYSSLILTAV